MFHPRLYRTRSGVFRRFFLYAGRAYVGRWFVVYNLFLVGLFPAFFIYSCVDDGVKEVRRIGNRDDDLHRAGRPPSAEELQKGLRRGAGRMRASDPQNLETPPFCLVTQNELQPGKKKNRKVKVKRWEGIIDQGAFLESGNGERVRISSEVQLLRDRAERTRKCEPEEEARWRKLRPEIPSGGWLEQMCIDVNETVFFEGCLGPQKDDLRVLEPCPKWPLRVVLNGGSPDSLIARAIDSIEGGLGRLYWVLIAALIYGWKLMRVRPFAQVLIRSLGENPSFPKMRWVFLAGAGSLFLLLSYFGFFISSAIAGCIAVAVAAGPRILTLGATMRHVKELPTTPLKDARGSLVKAQVRTPESVATSTGPLSNTQRAAFLLEIYEIVVHSSRHGRSPREQKRGEVFFQSVLPIEDHSGSGLVNLSHAVLDLDMVRSVVGRIALGEVGKRARAVLTDRRLSPASNHHAWVLEETQVRPGESLLIVGEATEVADPHDETSGMLPRFLHRDAAPLIVHAGTERSLLAHLRRELGYLIAMLLVMILAATVATATRSHLHGLRDAGGATRSNR